MLARSQGMLCGVYYRTQLLPISPLILLTPVTIHKEWTCTVICDPTLSFTAHTDIIQTIVTVVIILTCRIGYCKVWRLIGLLYFITAEQDATNSPYRISLTDKVCVLYVVSDTCNTAIFCIWLACVSSVYWVEHSDIWYRPSSDFLLLVHPKIFLSILMGWSYEHCEREEIKIIQPVDVVCTVQWWHLYHGAAR
jgi:hypothetical protein